MAQKTNTPDPQKALAALSTYVTDETFSQAVAACDDTAVPAEILVMLAGLRGLEEDTQDHASTAAADGFTLEAQGASDRADRYAATYQAILELWQS